MMTRRENGTGTVYKNQWGRWVGAITLPNGIEKRVAGERKRDVVIQLDAIRATFDDEKWDDVRHETSPRVIGNGLRLRVMERDGFRCRFCGLTPTDGATLVIDHHIPVIQGGSRDESNLWTLCTDCNAGKGGRRIEMRYAKSTELESGHWRSLAYRVIGAFIKAQEESGEDMANWLESTMGASVRALHEFRESRLASAPELDPATRQIRKMIRQEQELKEELRQATAKYEERKAQRRRAAPVSPAREDTSQ